MAKKVKVRKKDNRFCDPAVCDHCIYIGEGDFICDKTPETVFVMSDWDVTDDFMWCVYGSMEEYRKRRAEDEKPL